MISRRQTGTVIEWDTARGYGRIRPDHGGYCRAHHSDLPGGHGDLQVGERVSFLEVMTPDGWRAREIQYIDRSSRAPATGAKLGDIPSARRHLDTARRAMLAPTSTTRAQAIACGLIRPAKETP